VTNNTIYVGGEEGDCVIAIDGATNSVITTIGVGNSPTAFTYIPQQNRIYVANYSSSSISVIRDVTGIEENSETLSAYRQPFEIYPNPAKSVIRVRWSRDFSPVGKIPDSGTPFGQSALGGLKIFDVSGKLIRVRLNRHRPRNKNTAQRNKTRYLFLTIGK
jgi:YVTN family beta-propeller protein